MGDCSSSLLKQRMPHSHLSALIPGLELLIEAPPTASSVGLIWAFLHHVLLAQGLS